MAFDPATILPIPYSGRERLNHPDGAAAGRLGGGTRPTIKEYAMDFSLRLAGLSADFSTSRDESPGWASLEWGATDMENCIEIMGKLGMVNIAFPPTQPDHGLYDIPQELCEDGLRDDTGSSEYAAYQAAVRNVLAYDPAEPGIALRKLLLNDGFKVTPAECASALVIWDSLDIGFRKTIQVRPLHYWENDEDDGAVDEDKDRRPLAATGSQMATGDDPSQAAPYVLNPDNRWDIWIDWLRKAHGAGGFLVR
jgi:hypothetical protein